MNEDPNSSDDSNPSPLRTPEGLLILAAGEFLLVIAGYAIRTSFPVDEDPYRTLLWQGNSDLVGSGIGAVAGLLLFFAYTWVDRFQWPPLVRIRENLKTLLNTPLRTASWSHLVFVGLSAGLCEEYLFRGVLEPRLGFFSSNLLFALLHPHSILYVVIAFIIGAFMSLLVNLTGSLWAAILAHAFYDIAILAKMTREARRESLPSLKP